MGIFITKKGNKERVSAIGVVILIGLILLSVGLWVKSFDGYDSMWRIKYANRHIALALGTPSIDYMVEEVDKAYTILTSIPAEGNTDPIFHYPARDTKTAQSYQENLKQYFYDAQDLLPNQMLPNLRGEVDPRLILDQIQHRPAAYQTLLETVKDEMETSYDIMKEPYLSYRFWQGQVWATFQVIILIVVAISSFVVMFYMAGNSVGDGTGAVIYLSFFLVAVILLLATAIIASIPIFYSGPT